MTGYCANCDRDVEQLLSRTTETMHPREVNYCPTCGDELEER